MEGHDYRPPIGTKLGKAKALESVVLDDGTKLPKKAKVRYWIERQGAREKFFILHNDKSYYLLDLMFKRRFKVLIKAGFTLQRLLDGTVQPHDRNPQGTE